MVSKAKVEIKKKASWRKAFVYSQSVIVVQHALF